MRDSLLFSQHDYATRRQGPGACLRALTRKPQALPYELGRLYLLDIPGHELGEGFAQHEADERRRDQEQQEQPDLRPEVGAVGAEHG